MTNLVASRPTAGGDEAPAAPPGRGLLVGVPLALLAVVLYAVATGNGIYVLGFLGFVVALLVSVSLHEGGHYWTSQRFGMKATQFFVGFGPTIWSRQRGETEWGVKAIPAGGFVKIVGMTPLEEVAPGDEDRVFYKAPVWQKVVVLAAGSTVHFILAGLLLVGGTFLVGAPTEQAPAVGALSTCIAPDRIGVTDLPADTDLCTLPGSSPAPATAAGLQVGDVVTAVDGRPVDSGRDLTTGLRAAGARTVDLTVQRDEQELVLPITPTVLDRFALTDDGVDPEVLQPVGTIGISVQPRVDTEHLGVADSFAFTGTLIVQQLEGIKTTVTTKLGSITKVYSDERDPAGFVGIVGVGRISGEVIESDETAGVKAFTFISIIAGLNLFVGLFNLLPLLPLDGGHIAVALYEGTRDRLRRLRGYRGPFQRVDYVKLLPMTYGVAGLFLVFTLVLLGADIVNPIRLPQ